MAVKIAVASGKGGTGKTTVAANLFYALAEKGKEVTLADCDVEEPNDLLFFPGAEHEDTRAVKQEIPLIEKASCTFCRKCTEYCEFNSIVVIPPAGFAEINPSLCHSCGACLVACPENALIIEQHDIGTIASYRTGSGRIVEGRLKIGSAMQTMVIREEKKCLPEHEAVIILDAPPGTSCPVVETVHDADFIVLVTEPTPFGLHDLKLMIALLKELKNPFGVVINKAGLGDRKVYDYLQQESIDILAEIPFDRQYASHYAGADLFGDVPSAVRKGHRDLLQALEKRKLLK